MKQKQGACKIIKVFAVISLIFALVIFKTSMLNADEKSGFNYSIWAELLRTYVDKVGRVDYAALKDNMQPIRKFIKQIENADLSEMSPDGKKTFWINAYNAITVYVVTSEYPVNSIRNINFGFVWEIPRKAARRKLSLGFIEHKILRPLGDPRIHFALNCASLGCPHLPQEPFYPESLDRQLDREAKKFINDPAKIKFDKSTNTLYCSAIFNWFKRDFLKVSPSVNDFLKKYLNEKEAAYLNNNKIKLKFLKYDWRLNKQLKQNNLP